MVLLCMLGWAAGGLTNGVLQLMAALAGGAHLMLLQARILGLPATQGMAVNVHHSSSLVVRCQSPLAAADLECSRTHRTHSSAQPPLKCLHCCRRPLLQAGLRSFSLTRAEQERFAARFADYREARWEAGLLWAVLCRCSVAVHAAGLAAGLLLLLCPLPRGQVVRAAIAAYAVPLQRLLLR